MPKGSIIQMKFWNECEEFPWGTTYTVIQFIEVDGKVATLQRRIQETREKEENAALQAANTSGYQHYFWSRRSRHHKKKAQRLLDKGHRMVLRMLSRPLSTWDLKHCFCSEETFEQVKSRAEVEELRSDIHKATAWEFSSFALE